MRAGRCNTQFTALFQKKTHKRTYTRASVVLVARFGETNRFECDIDDHYPEKSPLPAYRRTQADLPWRNRANPICVSLSSIKRTANGVIYEVYLVHSISSPFYSRVQLVRGFILDNSWSQASSFLPPRCRPSFLSRIRFNIPTVQLLFFHARGFSSNFYFCITLTAGSAGLWCVSNKRTIQGPLGRSAWTSNAS